MIMIALTLISKFHAKPLVLSCLRMQAIPVLQFGITFFDSSIVFTKGTDVSNVYSITSFCLHAGEFLVNIFGVR